MKNIKSVFIFLSICILTISSSAYSFDADVAVSAKSIVFSSDDGGVKYFSVTIVDPNGDTVFSQSAQSSVTWTVPDNASDGRYKYQIKMSSVVAGSADRNTKTKPSTPKVVSQSGSVLVRSNALVIPELEEEVGLNSQSTPASKNIIERVASTILEVLVPVALADQVILDDLIVDGSVCVGTDCVNGEVFDFDTLRLDENNLRLHFNDTSNSAAFPNNDWRIVINDSMNGGANFFAIEDTTGGRSPFMIEAGAAENALFVDTNGRIGLGTSTPGTSLEVLTGSTPTMRLNQDGSLGFAAQAWDIGGNEGGFFISDVTNSLATPLHISAGAPSNSVYVTSAGNVGFGLDTPTEKLHVLGNAVISGNLELGSSRAIKHAIENLDLSQAISALLNLQPVKFRYNHSPSQQTIGFIAEDVPDLVASEGRKSLKPMDIVAVLTKVVQAQQATIEELSKKVSELAEQDGKN